MRRITAALLSVALLGVLAAPSAAPAAQQKNLVQTAVAAGQFTTLVKLVKQAGLAGTLSGTTKYTVLAPTDAAFKKVPKATLAALAKDKAKLRKVLLYHVLKGSVPASKVVKLTSARTVEGSKITIGVKGSSVYVNRTAKVTKTDVKASNGIIHVINRVLIPKDL
ncbi:MAG: fasciclin domain-containing protein [Solirubrobacteraceae bacterium]